MGQLKVITVLYKIAFKPGLFAGLIYFVKKACELLLFNRKLTAKEAYERNLVNEIIPHSEFEKLASKKIEQISQLPHQVEWVRKIF